MAIAYQVVDTSNIVLFSSVCRDEAEVQAERAYDLNTRIVIVGERYSISRVDAFGCETMLRQVFRNYAQAEDRISELQAREDGSDYRMVVSYVKADLRDKLGI